MGSRRVDGDGGMDVLPMRIMPAQFVHAPQNATCPQEERGRVAELESHIRKAGGDLTRLPVAGGRPAVHHLTATAAATVVQR